MQEVVPGLDKKAQAELHFSPACSSPTTEQFFNPWHQQLIERLC